MTRGKIYSVGEEDRGVVIKRMTRAQSRTPALLSTLQVLLAFNSNDRSFSTSSYPRQISVFFFFSRPTPTPNPNPNKMSHSPRPDSPRQSPKRLRDGADDLTADILTTASVGCEMSPPPSKKIKLGEQQLLRRVLILDAEDEPTFGWVLNMKEKVFKFLFTKLPHRQKTGPPMAAEPVIAADSAKNAKEKKRRERKEKQKLSDGLSFTVAQIHQLIGEIIEGALQDSSLFSPDGKTPFYVETQRSKMAEALINDNDEVGCYSRAVDPAENLGDYPEHWALYILEDILQPEDYMKLLAANFGRITTIQKEALNLADQFDLVIKVDKMQTDRFLHHQINNNNDDDDEESEKEESEEDEKGEDQ